MKNYTKAYLDGLTCKELRDIAKDLNISGRWDMTKAELVAAITGATVAKNADNKSAESAKEEVVIGDQTEADEEEKVNNESKKKSLASNVDMEKRMEYVERVGAGTLIAFRLPTGKVISAKIKRKSTKRRILQVETSYGVEHLVSFGDVIWVRTGKRWPRGVYNLLKGIDE
jgi:Rho termination factor, N-terminal domain.